MTASAQAVKVANREPMTVARRVLKEFGGNGGPGLVEFRGAFYEWYKGQWCLRDGEWLERMLWIVLENALVQRGDGEFIRYSPTSQKVKDVASAMRAAMHVPQANAPAWLGSPSSPHRPDDLEWCVGFQDKVIEVRPSGIKMYERTPDYFDVVTVPCEWGGLDAKCPVWEQCLEDWGTEKGWVEVLQLMMGYGLVSWRGLGRWFLMYGKVRAGKGVISRVLGMLLGDQAISDKALKDLGERYRLTGLERSRVLLVNEVNALDRTGSEEAVRVIKNMVGGDPVVIEEKYRRLEGASVISPAFPILVSNEVPQMPDKGQGLSAKMVLLPFTRSFLGKEDPSLVKKLKGEMPGIAAWALRGAIRLRASEKPTTLFPELRGDGSRDGVFESLQPFNNFLDDCFVPKPEGFVASRALWKLWQRWSKPKGVNTRGVNQYSLTAKLLAESSWDLRKVRYNDPQKTRGLRGLEVR